VARTRCGTGCSSAREIAAVNVGSDLVQLVLWRQSLRSVDRAAIRDGSELLRNG
jgi:hypothetical protein